jgi:hypothetical protein
MQYFGDFLIIRRRLLTKPYNRFYQYAKNHLIWFSFKNGQVTDFQRFQGYYPLKSLKFANCLTNMRAFAGVLSPVALQR